MTNASVPLKAIAVFPPSLDQATDDGYTVHVELSRELTQAEMTAIRGLARGMRGYGATLEIATTTIEAVAEQVGEIASILVTVENSGREQDARVEAIAEQHRLREEAQAAEEERLRKIAASITFE